MVVKLHITRLRKTHQCMQDRERDYHSFQAAPLNKTLWRKCPLICTMGIIPTPHLLKGSKEIMLIINQLQYFAYFSAQALVSASAITNKHRKCFSQVTQIMEALSQNIYFVIPAPTANEHPAMSFLLGCKFSSLLCMQDKFRCSSEMERFYLKKLPNGPVQFQGPGLSWTSLLSVQNQHRFFR